jgi:photosystem II stability/assembly factor-like uncharacterized protein
MKKLYLAALVLSFFCNLFPQTWQVQSPKPAGVALYDVVSLSTTRVLAFGMAGKEMISTDAGETWNANANLDIPNDIWGSYFLSDNTTGWIVGTGGKIMKTTDAGNTWTSQTSGTTNQLYDIEFSTVNTNLGIAVGDLGTVLTTTDDGATWVAQTSPGTSPYGPIYKVAIVPGSTTDVWIGLNNGTAPKEKLMKSTNFGVSFTNTTPTGIAVAIFSIYITDANHIWIGASNHGMYITTNGGTSWTNPYNETYQIYDLKATTATNGFGVTAKGAVFTTTNSGTSWTKAQTSTAQQLRAICFNTGYIITVGDASNIYKSTDGGNTWVAKYFAADQVFTRCIIFKDDNHGLAGDQSGNLWQTTDGGSNWSILHNFNTSSSNQIYYISMPSATTWYIACDHTLLYKTTDAGATFSQITTTGISGTTTTFWSVAFVDDQNGMVGAGGGVVLKTTNGGISWSDVSTLAGIGSSNTVNYIEPQAPSTFYFATGTNSGKLVKTTDGGASFSTLAPPVSTGGYYTVKFKDNYLGLLGGGNGSLQRTTDGGSTWTSITSPTTGTIYSFVFSGSNVWLCSGALGVGDIANSTDNGATFTLDKKLTSNYLYCMAISNNNLWVSGAEGTILKGTISSHALTLNLSAFIQALTNVGGTAMTNAVNPITVTVELHNATTPFALIESQTGTLSTIGVGTFTFTTSTNGNPYYFVVKSGNSIETWSSTVKSFYNNLLSYDFTTAGEQAFASNMIQIGSKWCIYSGDANQDGLIDSGDMLPVDNDYTNYAYGTGLVNDINGDGLVDSGDLLIVDNNYTNYIYAAKPDGAAGKVVKHQVVRSVVKNVQ